MTAADRVVTLYDAFSEVPGGGSVAGVVGAASGFSAERMQQIAAEVGAPATCFVTGVGSGVDSGMVDVRFFSTLTEYPMCGHGTIAVFTWLVEEGLLELGPQTVSWTLRTPGGTATVDLVARPDGRTEVMLALEPTVAEPCTVSAAEVAPLLGIGVGAILEPLAIEAASADFTHLVVRVDSLATIGEVAPDHAAVADLCRRIGADTLAVFTTETRDPEVTIRCRDFCPAVGTPEAAATGTTNRALACHLVRRGLVKVGAGDQVVMATQGVEMGRPSVIRTEVTMVDGLPSGLRVGGVATRTSESTTRLW
ncbi:MAG: PhzF family phenazine biosynthesis isomerase [Acidimicrobiales bacterium]|jgi:PhzF family phenazine biosynthesis protein|nr:PhzF family phenazine biosynthesis isomerase [Acidimicrobiales bacterium]